MADIREGQVRVDADVPSARDKAGYFLCVEQQAKFVGCCPGGQALAVRRCCTITPVDVLAVEVANIQTEVWEHRDGHYCEL